MAGASISACHGHLPRDTCHAKIAESKCGYNTVQYADLCHLP